MIVGTAWAFVGLALAAFSWVIVTPINLYFLILGAAATVVGISHVVSSRCVE